MKRISNKPLTILRKLKIKTVDRNKVSTDIDKISMVSDSYLKGETNKVKQISSQLIKWG